MFSKDRSEAVREFKEYHKAIDENAYLEDKEELENEEKLAWKMIEDR